MYRVLFIEETYEKKKELKDYISTYCQDRIFLNTAYDGHDGLSILKADTYDLVIVDIALSGESGIEICRRIRENCSCPILFISALDTDEDVEYGYALGAEEYIVKPFSASDLMAEINDYIDNGNDPNFMSSLECEGIRMNALTGLVTVDGRVINLTEQTTKLLRVLLENKSENVSREMLLKRVWGYDYKGNERALDAQIKRLRKQLGNKAGLIHTARGFGYRISKS